MSRIIWDEATHHYYESGISKGVIFYRNEDGTYENGVAWNGLVSITETSEGVEPTSLYADNIKYLTLYSPEEFGLTIQAYTYPPGFIECDGSAELLTGMVITQQKRRRFALSYRTIVGNEIWGNDYAYKIHIVYGCMTSPSERPYQTMSDSPEAITFSWDVSTLPVKFADFKPVAHVIIDSKTCAVDALEQIEAQLYGSATNDSTLLFPEDIRNIIEHPIPNLLINEDRDYITIGGFRIIVPNNSPGHK